MEVDNNVLNTPIPKGSAFHFGNKGISAKEMGLYGRVPEFLPVDNTPKTPQRPTTERQKDYDRFMEDGKFGAGGAFERSKVYDAPRADEAVFGAVLGNFNANAVFEDLNGNLVARISLESRQETVDKTKREMYIPGGSEGKRTIIDIAQEHDMPEADVRLQLKKGVKMEMRHTLDELKAIDIVKRNLFANPLHYNDVVMEEFPENSMGISAYEKYAASSHAIRMQRVLEDVNRLFGTAYYVDNSYPKRFEEVFVIKSAKVDADGIPVGNTKLVDFQEEQEKQGKMMSAVAGMYGMRSPADDGSPWREMTEPLPHDPYRSAIAGSSARNV